MSYALRLHVTIENLENMMRKSENFRNQEKVHSTEGRSVTKNVTNNCPRLTLFGTITNKYKYKRKP